MTTFMGGQTKPYWGPKQPISEGLLNSSTINEYWTSGNSLNVLTLFHFSDMCIHLYARTCFAVPLEISSFDCLKQHDSGFGLLNSNSSAPLFVKLWDFPCGQPPTTWCPLDSYAVLSLT